MRLLRLGEKRKNVFSYSASTLALIRHCPVSSIPDFVPNYLVVPPPPFSFCKRILSRVDRSGSLTPEANPTPSPCRILHHGGDYRFAIRISQAELHEVADDIDE
jgi:hypothetical protein